MASVMMSHKKKGGGKRKVAHVRVERAANGYTVSHRLEPMKSRKPGGMMSSPYEEDQPPAVFSGAKAHKQMMSHVGDLMQQGQDDGGAGDAGMPDGTQAA